MAIIPGKLSSAMVVLECPVCMLIPRKEIYQCTNGHSICNDCVIKLENCPTCRVAFSSSKTGKIRNHYAETLLDEIKFPCRWKENGCDVLIARRELSDHESICKNSTFGRPMNLCSIFQSTKRCQFNISTQDLSDPIKVADLLSHLNFVHNIFAAKTVKWNSPTFTLTYPVESVKRGFRNLQPFFVHIVETNKPATSSDLFLLLKKLEKDEQKHLCFSLGIINLTSEKEGARSTIKVKVSIKARNKQHVAKFWGDECVQDITWTMKPKNAPKFQSFLDMPIENRPSYPFSLPVSHIEKYFVDLMGDLKIQYSFQK